MVCAITGYDYVIYYIDYFAMLLFFRINYAKFQKAVETHEKPVCMQNIYLGKLLSVKFFLTTSL